jgi:gluconolactonase
MKHYLLTRTIPLLAAAASLSPEGAPEATIDLATYTPHAGGAAFDDSRWEAIAPTSLTERRSTGRLCFAWYRINITVPERVGAFDTKVRFARLSFYRAAPGPVAIPVSEVNVEVIRKDPAMDAIVGANPKIFKLAEGFQFTEGPIWIRDGGYLLFSDPNANTIYKYVPDRQLSVFRTPSGYSGADIAEYGQPGSNGLTVDRQGRLTINEHGNRRVTRLEKDGSLTVLAERYQGKRLNSPNDLVYRSDGTLYFTDPPFGLPKFFDDPGKELPVSGVYSVYHGRLQQIATDFTGPNGIAFSPGEKYLYVTNWDEKKKAIMRYEALPDGTLANGKLFFDMTAAPGEDALDGMKVDQQGNLYASGPGGLWVISAEGTHLGTIIAPMHPHNLAWGDEDGKTLYLCARTGLYRMRLNIAGVRP